LEFWFLIFGALLALVGALFHGIIGHIKYIGNVNSSDLTDLSKSLSLVSWHVFTIFLIISSMTLIYVALNLNLYIALYPIIATNLFGAFLFIILGLSKHKILLKMPGAYLMGGTAIFALLGI
tara:strand:+ start:1225 stop:1590 length:366 start_codon:yes stop_codon:yes gene_type:complete